MSRHYAENQPARENYIYAPMKLKAAATSVSDTMPNDEAFESEYSLDQRGNKFGSGSAATADHFSPGLF